MVSLGAGSPGPGGLNFERFAEMEISSWKKDTKTDEDTAKLKPSKPKAKHSIKKQRVAGELGEPLHGSPKSDSESIDTRLDFTSRTHALYANLEKGIWDIGTHLEDQLNQIKGGTETEKKQIAALRGRIDSLKNIVLAEPIGKVGAAGKGGAKDYDQFFKKIVTGTIEIEVNAVKGTINSIKDDLRNIKNKIEAAAASQREMELKLSSNLEAFAKLEAEYNKNPRIFSLTLPNVWPSTKEEEGIVTKKIDIILNRLQGRIEALLIRDPSLKDDQHIKNSTDRIAEIVKLVNGPEKLKKLDHFCTRINLLEFDLNVRNMAQREDKLREGELIRHKPINTEMAKEYGRVSFGPRNADDSKIGKAALETLKNKKDMKWLIYYEPRAKFYCIVYAEPKKVREEIPKEYSDLLDIKYVERTEMVYHTTPLTGLDRNALENLKKMNGLDEENLLKGPGFKIPPKDAV